MIKDQIMIDVFLRSPSRDVVLDSEDVSLYTEDGILSPEDVTLPSKDVKLYGSRANQMILFKSDKNLEKCVCESGIGRIL